MRILIHFLISSLLSVAWAQDPLFNQQWGMRNTGQSLFRAVSDIRQFEIKGTQGLDVSLPSTEKMAQLSQQGELIVAVIDSGIDVGHPEFTGRLLPGKDFLDNAAMADDTGHGTHVAGIIAANSNGQGIQGITPANVKILPLKVLNKNTTEFVYNGKVITDIIADAIGHALQAGAKVINVSLGWPQIINGPRIIRALEEAAARDVIIVAAAGNNNKDVPAYPCSHPAVICVGAIDNQGKVAEFSNHGGKVDMVAPGEWIVSTVPRNVESRSLRIHAYDAKNGSSQAAPFVSAAAALLRLQEPALTSAEVKARLYASSLPLETQQDGKFVRFGRLCISCALEKTEAVIASVNVKELITVDVHRGGQFSLRLPLETLGTQASVSSASISGLNANASITGNELKLEGTLSDLNLESEVPITINLKLAGQTFTTPLTLSFARKIELDDLKRVAIPANAANGLVRIQGQRRLTRMSYPSIEGQPRFDFQGYTHTKVGDTIVVTALNANSTDVTVRTQNYSLENLHQLLSVFEKDVNLDGVNDMVFYGLNKTRDHLVLQFTNLQGTPLFGAHSRWEMPITSFEGLPLKEGEFADFAWLRINTFLGDLIVPYYQREWLLPTEDNSLDILDFETPRSDLRAYYWEPYRSNDKTLARPRVVDHLRFKENLRRQLRLTRETPVDIVSLLPQTIAEKDAGVVRHLIAVGDGFTRKMALLTLKKLGQFEAEFLASQDPFLQGSKALVSRDLMSFQVTDLPYFFTLLERAHARLSPLLSEDGEDGVKTSGWSNPFFETVGVFSQDQSEYLFMESRYHVYAYYKAENQERTALKLPINRDSSFPGVDFSETLQASVIKSAQGKLPGVAVNSTLIYGDRLYTMVRTPSEFYRPTSLSLKLPAQCAPLKPRYLSVSEEVSAYVLLCMEDDQSVKLSFYPLTLE